MLATLRASVREMNGFQPLPYPWRARQTGHKIQTAMILLASIVSSLSSIVIPLAIVVVCAGVLLAVLSIVKRRMRVEPSTSRDFSLTELRDLHRAGKLTDDEFERAKALLVGRVHSQLAKEAKRTSGPASAAPDLKSDQSD